MLPSRGSRATRAAPRAPSSAGTRSARASSTACCKPRSMVSATLLPGWGAVSYRSLTTRPSLLLSTTRTPGVPRSQLSKAASAPSMPTVSSIWYPRAL